MRAIRFTYKELSVEAREMIRLALPVVLAQVAQMSMGFVDTWVVAGLGAEPLAAVASGNVIHYFYLVFSFGVLAAVSPMVAQAFGAKDDVEIGRSVAQGLWLALFLGLLGIVVAFNIEEILLLFGQEPEVATLAGSYNWAMAWGILPTLFFSVFRAFSDAINRTRVAMMVAFAAVLVNGVADYALVYGHLGMPELGAVGAGYATSIVRWASLLLMLIYIFRTPEFKKYRFLYRARIVRPRYFGEMLRLGLPIGATHSMEHGAFGFTSLLMGWISTTTLAAHQVSIMIAALTFMVPLGTSFAITARVGQAIGRGSRREAALAGYVGIGIGLLFMMITATIYISIPSSLAQIFTNDPEIIEIAIPFLVIAGIFQLSDGLQVLSVGALRGLKETKRPMITNLISYWVLGIPLGYLLAFKLGYGGVGLWWGLVIGLTVAGVLHAHRFLSLTSVK